MASRETPGAGAAQELPSGRLAGFEDADQEQPQLATLLSRRARPASPPAEPAAGPAEDPGAEPGGLEGRDVRPEGQAPAPQDTASPGSPTPSVPPPAEAAAPRTPAEELPEAAGDSGQPAAIPAAGRPRIRPSIAYVPVAIRALIDQERKDTGRSNGHIVIVAIEACGDRLTSLVGAREPAGGGGLFTARAPRTARASEEPLTSLNIRLYEQDYEVLDQLVEASGASSRSHLITTALNAYFASARGDQTPSASRGT